MATGEQAKTVQEAYHRMLHASPGVVGMGCRPKDGAINATEMAVCIYVENQHIKDELEQLLAKEVGGVPIVVVVTERLRIHFSGPSGPIFSQE